MGPSCNGEVDSKEYFQCAPPIGTSDFRFSAQMCSSCRKYHPIRKWWYINECGYSVRMDHYGLRAQRLRRSAAVSKTNFFWKACKFFLFIKYILKTSCPLPQGKLVSLVLKVTEKQSNWFPKYRHMINTTLFFSFPGKFSVSLVFLKTSRLKRHIQQWD